MARRGTLLAFIRATPAPLDTPLVPGSWDVTPEAHRWSTVYPLGRLARPDVFFHARLIVRDSGTPTRAMFVCVGAPVVLQALADRIASDGIAFTRTWATLPLFRADAQATAATIRAAWPDERPRDAGLNPIGTLVALWSRMAGFDDDDAEG
jgi:hypothetical protein